MQFYWINSIYETLFHLCFRRITGHVTVLPSCGGSSGRDASAWGSFDRQARSHEHKAFAFKCEIDKTWSVAWIWRVSFFSLRCAHSCEYSMGWNKVQFQRKNDFFLFFYQELKNTSPLQSMNLEGSTFWRILKATSCRSRGRIKLLFLLFLSVANPTPSKGQTASQLLLIFQRFLPAPFPRLRFSFHDKIKLNFLQGLSAKSRKRKEREGECSSGVLDFKKLDVRCNRLFRSCQSWRRRPVNFSRKISVCLVEILKFQL